jgi:hypothetical protein
MKVSQIREDIEVLKSVAADEKRLDFVRSGALRTITILETMLEEQEVRTR